MSRLFFPATQRNREPIARELARMLPQAGTVLEIASGSGEHGVYFAERFPTLHWQPSDPDATHVASIAAWRAETGLANLREPLELDVMDPIWPIEAADALFCANMIHIAPWEATLGLLDGASRLLSAGAPVMLYGPYKRGGQHTAPSNAAFDDSLRRRNATWGVRDLDVVAAEAAARGFHLVEAVSMPANNLTVWFEKES